MLKNQNLVSKIWIGNNYQVLIIFNPLKDVLTVEIQDEDGKIIEGVTLSNEDDDDGDSLVDLLSLN